MAGQREGWGYGCTLYKGGGDMAALPIREGGNMAG